jgi:uncharacterized membrane protein YcaP (DUF421 family)
MFDSVSTFLDNFLGLYAETIDTKHMIFRALAVYLGGIILFRLNKQLLGVKTVFNMVINFLIGSILAEGITGSADYISVIATSLSLIFVNWAVEMLVYFVPGAEHLINGSPTLLIKNGIIQWRKMALHSITENELREELHHKLHTDDLSKIKDAYIEATGEISFIKKN